MERVIREAHWGYYSFVLKAGEVAEKGYIAAIDTADGSVINATAEAGLLPIGIFHETKTGDGKLKIQVKLWREIQLTWWANDDGAIVIADRGKTCYLKDKQTVSLDGASKAGIIFDVDPKKGVLVFFDYETLAPPAGP